MRVCNFLNLWEGDMPFAYERLNCRFFNCTIGVLQGCTLQSSLVYAFEELEQMVNEFVKQESIEEVTNKNVFIMLLVLCR